MQNVAKYKNVERELEESSTLLAEQWYKGSRRISIVKSIMHTRIMAAGLTIVVGCAHHAAQRCRTCHHRAKNTENSMTLREVTPEEANQLMSEQRYLYVDVRTPAEFQAGRPAHSINIPVALPNPTTGRMQLNPEFLDVVEAVVPKDSQVIVGCRSGHRSAMAQKLMHEAGYEHTANMLGGFSGDSDPTGHVLTEGWSTLGLPVARGDTGANGYAAIKTKVPSNP